MHCITVLYPKVPGTTFDTEYYLDVHVPLAFRELKRRFGVTPVRVDCLTDCRSIRGAEAAGNSDYHAIFHMYFRTREDAERMIELRNSAESSSVELRADIRAYTNADLQGVVSQVQSRDVEELLARADVLVADADRSR
jgi:hypothetical protein